MELLHCTGEAVGFINVKKAHLEQIFRIAQEIINKKMRTPLVSGVTIWDAANHVKWTLGHHLQEGENLPPNARCLTAFDFAAVFDICQVLVYEHLVEGIDPNLYNEWSKLLHILWKKTQKINKNL